MYYIVHLPVQNWDEAVTQIEMNHVIVYKLLWNEKN